MFLGECSYMRDAVGSRERIEKSSRRGREEEREKTGERESERKVVEARECENSWSGSCLRAV